MGYLGRVLWEFSHYKSERIYTENRALGCIPHRAPHMPESPWGRRAIFI